MDSRKSSPSLLGHALLALVHQQPMSGYDLRKLFAESHLQHFSSSPGSIYPALQRLEEIGLIAGVTEQTDTLRPRKVYSITAEGTRVLRRWLEGEVTREDVINNTKELTLRFAFMGHLLDDAATVYFLDEVIGKLAPYVDELDEFNRETAMTMGKRERVFLEERLKEVETLLSDAENSLRDFQEKNRTVSLSEELTQAIEAAALLKAEIVTREIRLNVIRKFATDENPMVKRLRSEIAEFKQGLHRIEYGKAEKADQSPPEFGAGFSIPFAELPEIALELARLTREAKIQSEIYILLTQQYEQAKIAEAKDTPTVQILDEALPPERRSYPQRKKMVIVAGILSLFAGIGAAFLLEYVEGLRSRPDEYGDWKEMVGQLYGDLKSLKSMILRR